MKVSDIFETDEWTNKPETLKYLYKKQLSATHAFMVEVEKLLRQDNIVAHQKIELRAISKWKTIPTQPSYMISSNFSIQGLRLPTLEIKLDRMVDAKYQYEEAGGKYDKSGPWEVPS